jgi:hypothetical protein
VVTVVINVLFVPAFSYLACAWATLAAYGSMMILSYILGQKYFPVRYNLRAIAVYVALGFVLYIVSKLFDSIPYTVVRIFMNNLLILVFVWIVYKLEINNLKNLTTNVSAEN